MTRNTYRHGDLHNALVAVGLQQARSGGPQALVLREATRQAGVAPNAAYRHFPRGYPDWFDAVREAALAHLAAAMAQAVAEARQQAAEAGVRAQATAALAAVGAAYLRFADREPGWFLTACAPAVPSGDATVTPHARQESPARPAGPLQWLNQALDDMVQAGALVPAHRPGAEYLAWSAVHGMAMLTLQGPLGRLPAQDYQMLGQRLLNMVVLGLQAPSD